MIKSFFLCWLLMMGHFALEAQSPKVRKEDYFIDDARSRIDALDGAQDGIVQLNDSLRTAWASRVYLAQTDSLQQLITRMNFNDQEVRKYRGYLYYLMLGVNRRNVNNLEAYQRKIQHAYYALQAIQNNQLLAFLQSQPALSLEIFGFIKHRSEYGDFLGSLAAQMPDKLFDKFYQFAEEPYAVKVIEAAAMVAPNLAKKFIIPNNAINLALEQSNKPEVKLIYRITEAFGKKSNAYLLIGEIASGNLTLEAADSIGKNPALLFRKLVEIKQKNQSIAAYSVEFELGLAALRLVREINELHNETNEEVRFKVTKDLSAAQLYTLMVYSEEEIFTSSFNGVFNRFITRLGKKNGYEFLQELNHLHFRTMIKMSAGFNTLGRFLKTMNKAQSDSLLVRFASGLESEENDLSQAVQVADTYGSLQDSTTLKLLSATIASEYDRCNQIHSVRGKSIYGLLLNLFADRKAFNAKWFSSIAEQYHLPALDRIPCQNFFTQNDTVQWMIYFYDDEDGEASFASFLTAFNDKNWKVADREHYVLIYSASGTPVMIYANKPKSEYEGQEELEKLFNARELSPDVLVHRGHSYYAYKTIEKVDINTEVFVLGSCGGYNSLSKIFDRAPEINIISSKQIGTMFVNNPMIKLMADRLREGKDMIWQEVWDDLGKKVKPNPKAYERFLDYIPPHKNLGAIFIRAYQKLTEANPGSKS